VIKRKQVNFDSNSEGLYERSDFKQRKELAFAGKKLKDNRPSSQFEIFPNGTYVNDPTEQLYEIYRSEVDDRRYLVFLLSIFKISMAYDEELMMREMDIGLSITPEQGKNSWFKSNAQFQIVAVLATALVIVAFFVALYFLVLPAHIKNSVFGIANDVATAKHV